MSLSILTLRIQLEHDVVAARQRTRQLAQALGFDTQQQTRLATSVSEIARNAFLYAGGGRIAFSLEGATSPQLLQINVSDSGPGIQALDDILSGTYKSATGMGLGLIGAQRLMDQFRVTTSPSRGTIVTMGKLLPRRAPIVTAASLPQILQTLEQQHPRDLLDEFREQNRELLRTLEELQRRQQELSNLNRELEDTNRGVVALYAELDEKADSLRRADEVKSRFLSNMSHEFRTPLNSVLALSRLLLDRTDGDLTTEQEIQVSFIRKSAESLTELVNDLLDLAKVEAGKIDIHPVSFEIGSLFGALRGMLRPLLLTSALNLVFEEANDIPPLFTDEGKISQILRNFISNALKFTEAGEVRVNAEYDAFTELITFRVADTGIGIPPEHLETIFLEFAQVDSPLQRKYKGTGLGLPLSRRLAELLHGTVGVTSQPHAGSVFSLQVPRIFTQPEPALVNPLPEEAPLQNTVLLVEDNYETRLAYEKYLRGTPWRVVSARSVQEAEGVLRVVRPRAVVLDIALGGEDAWDFLAQVKGNAATREIPVIVATSVDDQGKAFALGAAEYLAKPVSRQMLREVLEKVVIGTPRILIVDDEDVARYLARQLFSSNAELFEATEGNHALQIARETKPDLIVVDLLMPGLNGFDTIRAIRSDEFLRSTPIVVATSKDLSAEEREVLEGQTAGILSKQQLLTPETAEILDGALKNAGLDPALLTRRSQR